MYVDCRKIVVKIIGNFTDIDDRDVGGDLINFMRKLSSYIL